MPEHPPVRDFFRGSVCRDFYLHVVLAQQFSVFFRRLGVRKHPVELVKGGIHHQRGPVNALKSFGGGDGYAASFLNGVLQGWDIMDCLEMGSAEAAMLVASHGCSADMPSEEAVRQFIKKEKEEYGEMIARA